MNNKNSSILRDEDVEISLKDLLAFCFLHWRSAIVLCLVAGCLLGGYKGVNTYKSSSTADKAISAPPKGSTEEVLKEYQEQIKSEEEYLNHSELMNIDATNESYSQVTMLITSDQLNTSVLSSLKSSYIAHFEKGAFLKKVAKEYKLDPKYINELVSVKNITTNSDAMLNPDTNSINYNQFFSQLVNSTSSSLTISVIASNEKTSEGILNAIIDEANTFNVSLSKDFGAHQISFVSRVYTVLYDKDTSSAQTRSIKSVLDTKASYKDYATKFQDELSANTPVISDANSAHKQAVKTGIKWFLTGALGIFLVYGFVLCIVYITSAKPITREQFYSRYGLFALGSFTDGRKNLYKNSSRFDKWLRKTMGLHTILDLDEVYDLISANLNVYQNDKKSFVLIGAVNDNMKNEIADELSQKMDNCEFTVCQDLLNEPTARLSLSKADAIIFVEKYGASNYEDIDREIALALKSEIEIAGCINY